MSSIAEPVGAKGPFQGPTPGYLLYNAGAVGLATLLGGPVAGTSLMAVNYRHLGQGKKGVVGLTLGIVATGLLILIGWNVPSSVTGPIGLAMLFATLYSARSLQGAAVQEHLRSGGRLASGWNALGTGLVFLGAVFGIVFLAETLTTPPKIMVGKDEVSYSGSATKEEAEALGNALKTSGYFEDRGVSVSLTKGKEGTIVSFVTKEEAWDQSSTVSLFEEIGREVAPSVGGLPITVRLTNKMGDTKTQSNVGKVDFTGGDSVYYMGSATQSDAQSLGQSLNSNGFFKGKGSDVFLTKHTSGTTLSFVMGDGAWSDPALVSEFEKVVRQVAPAVGGLPVTLRLVTPTLEEKKEEIIR